MPKFVASHDPEAELPWPNSTLLHGDVAAGVAALKADGDGDLVTMGSGELIHPLLLGAGRRLFDGAQAAELQLVDALTSTSGVIVATYRPA